MLLTSLQVGREDFEAATGWAVKPEGLCRDEMCVPFPMPDGPTLDVAAAAERLGMPLVHDATHGLWALGPSAGGRALDSAQAPDLVLPDLDGNPFALRSLRGQKVFLLAWASW